MRKSIIALVMGGAALAMAVPAPVQAHWRHTHWRWHHVWHRGPSYYPPYAYYDANPYGPACAWNRSWDGYWHRDCF
ncbi:MAG TPA: hypothetical protein VHU22_25075 [Xanthobacteraceae bacterium]|jgi:hypothetical protein|nr:hypothetical protein [Xanthobacteraceae bacterium]